MNASGKYYVSSRIYAYEAFAFLVTIAVIWCNELFDLPHLLFGTAKTPVNWSESIFETLLLLFFGCAIIFVTHKLFRRMKYLEGILPVCAACKKIRDEQENWHPIEEYIRARSDAEFSHGLCPECAKKLYPEFHQPVR